MWSHECIDVYIIPHPCLPFFTLNHVRPQLMLFVFIYWRDKLKVQQHISNACLTMWHWHDSWGSSAIYWSNAGTTCPCLNTLWVLNLIRDLNLPLSLNSQPGGDLVATLLNNERTVVVFVSAKYKRVFQIDVNCNCTILLT